jgi:predicted Fe-Mo cluster-binding NifX family protein
MKIAFTTKGNSMDSEIDPRFGRTQYILVYDTELESTDVIDNTDTASEGHGAGPKTAQRLLETEAEVLITGNGPGGNAASVLNRKGIKILVGAAGISAMQALEKFKKNELTHF